jgi:hypothetical protein
LGAGGWGLGAGMGRALGWAERCARLGAGLGWAPGWAGLGGGLG